MQLQWHDTIGGGSFAGGPSSIMRRLCRNGDGFVCEWIVNGQDSEDWLLDPVLDLAAAKAVVESWETEEGWEDDDS